MRSGASEEGRSGRNANDDPPANLDRLLDPPKEPAVQIAPHDLEDHLAVLA
jgi:hypothetical protein